MHIILYIQCTHYLKMYKILYIKRTHFQRDNYTPYFEVWGNDTPPQTSGLGNYTLCTICLSYRAFIF